MSQLDPLLRLNRRHFFKTGAAGIGGLALSSLLDRTEAAVPPELGRLAPKAKRVIYLFQSGGPSQHDLFDPKPLLREKNGQQLPPEVRGDQRLTGMSANQSSLPLAGSHFEFSQAGQSGAWFSELLPHHREIADELCIVRSMYTEAINHDPAITFFQTGSQIAGRPSMGSWISYGLGSLNDNLPSFIVLVSAGQGGQPLYARLWGSGFLDSKFQGVRFRSGKDPVLYLSNPEGICRSSRRSTLDAIAALEKQQFHRELDPEIESRIAQYEMAYRMQTSVPDATDLSSEPDETFALYGEDSRKPGTFAANCLLARRLAERDVRFIQLYHQGWDQHGNLPSEIRQQALETDQASAALVKDLKRRGLLDDTLVVWGGEFGRTAYSQGELGSGRDHHGRCFSMWLAGGGVKGGTAYGTTDDYAYNIVEGGCHIRDLNATMLHTLGIDHERFTFRFQGLENRLTGVEEAHVIQPILANRAAAF